MDTLSLSGVKNDRRGLAAALRLSDSRLWRRVALGAILLLAAGLLFYNLNELGYANHYYTAGVASMLKSWHNFFFVAAEPGASVSIDKPPVGLWLQAISAYFLGVNGFAMVLPEILCGLAAIVVLYHLVRRASGSTVAALLAALALAITPIVVATDRNNTIDSSLILTLLLAAWAFIKATESGRLRYLLLGALLVGIGFNIKMLQAYLPLPAFYALYFLGARTPFWRKLGRLALATLLLLTVSFAWITVVDLVPASQRPYVGSSGTNSELNLAIGYNGLQRLTGVGGNVTSFLNRLTVSATANGNGGFGGGPGGFGGNGVRGGGTAGGGFGGGGPGGGGAFPGTGQPGLTRLFTAPLSKEVSWLLPFGLFTLALLAVRSRLRWPLEPKHQAIVLWGGWLITGAVFFSVAGFFHEYYLSMLAAPLAALVGIGVVELWRVSEQRPWLGMGLMLSAAAATLALQLTTADAYVRLAWWLLVPVVLFVMAIVWLGASAVTRQRLFGLIGAASLVGAMLFVPGVWSGLTTLNTSSNQSLPAAYGGGGTGPANGGSTQVNQKLLAYLQANTQGMKYLMAVPSSMQGSDYVIATGRPVLYLGGFMGIDPVETPASLQALVDSGQLRYIYWDANGNGRGGGGPGGANGGDQAGISNWVKSQCTAVTGYNTNTQNQGAPDGTGNFTNNTPGGGFGGGFGGQLQVTLYDCAAAG